MMEKMSRACLYITALFNCLSLLFIVHTKMVDSKSTTSFNTHIPKIYITQDDYKNVLLLLNICTL